MFTVKPRAMASSADPLRPITFQRRNRRPKDILIDVHYAGIATPTLITQVLNSATPSRRGREAMV